MTLRPATSADFGFIRGLAQRPDYAPFISDDDEAALAAHLANPAHRLLIWEGAGANGFALYFGIGDPSGAVELRRLALADTGTGAGRGFLDDMIGYAFRDLEAKRLWLDASSENPRAQRVYERAGFTLEGRLRQHWYRPALGRCVDLLLFGMLREEWAARQL